MSGEPATCGLFLVLIGMTALRRR
ncbi:MAG: PEP-CTERM sorting domain-containing protein [Treponema sp.]|nr:PEP-CTERM sorting domain-containing protein [Treponema sp.]